MRFTRYVAPVVMALAISVPAFAQEPPVVDSTIRTDSTTTEGGSQDAALQQAPRPGIPLPPSPFAVTSSQKEPSFFKQVARDYKNFFSSDTARVMGFFAVGAVAAAPWDREGVNNGFNIPTTVFQAGNVMGMFVFQVSAGAATYGMGKAFDDGKLASVGKDIVRSQLLSQGLVQALKHTVRRERPDGSNNSSFPSGHSASAFATAGVLHRYYGWKVGVPAYALGSYVALARMAWNRHHATDVVMGAGFGIASARTVTMNFGKSRFNMGVQPQAGGASINFTKIYP